MQIYEWEPHGVYHHASKFCDHKYCDSADIRF